MYFLSGAHDFAKCWAELYTRGIVSDPTNCKSELFMAYKVYGESIGATVSPSIFTVSLSIILSSEPKFTNVKNGLFSTYKHVVAAGEFWVDWRDFKLSIHMPLIPKYDSLGVSSHWEYTGSWSISRIDL